MTQEQLAKAWLKTHPRTNAETLYDAERAGFELLEVNGAPALVHRADHTLIEDAVAGVAAGPDLTTPDHTATELHDIRRQRDDLQAELDATRQALEQSQQDRSELRERLNRAALAAQEAGGTKDCQALGPGSTWTAGTTVNVAIPRSAGQRAYNARQQGKRWADMAPGSLQYARAYARSRALPWPPEPAK